MDVSKKNRLEELGRQLQESEQALREYRRRFITERHGDKIVNEAKELLTPEKHREWLAAEEEHQKLRDHWMKELRGQ